MGGSLRPVQVAGFTGIRNENENANKKERKDIVSTLLLFNVASHLANPSSNYRFQFDRFKAETWDIEHIRSVSSGKPKTTADQKSWLNGVISYIGSYEKEPGQGRSRIGPSDEELEIRNQCRLLVNDDPFNSSKFEELFDLILGHYQPDADDDVDHSIGNLTLLDSSTNRGYRNAIFPVKRSHVIALDKSATFVPLCTKNVFLKYYSNQIDNMLFWGARDSKEHEAAIEHVLTDFFNAGTSIT